MASITSALLAFAVGLPMAVSPQVQLGHMVREFSCFSDEVVEFLKQISQSTLLLTSTDWGEDYQHEAENLIAFYSTPIRATIVLHFLNEKSYTPQSNTTEISFNYHPLLLKFNAHRAHLLLRSITDFIRRNDFGWSEILHLIYNLKSPQDMYVIFSAGSAENEPSLLETLKLFKGLSMPSPFVFVWDSRVVEMLCTFCAFQALPSGPLFYSIHGMSLHEQNELYTRVHSNLRRTTVELKGFGKVDNFCGPYMHEKSDHAVTCSMFEVLSDINATIRSNEDFNYPDKWDYDAVSFIVGWIYVGVAGELRNQSRIVQYDWVIGCETLIPFSFVNVVDGDATGFSAIWEAVDPDVLPLITSAALAVVVLLSFVFKSITSALALVLSLSIETYYLRQKYGKKMSVILVLAIFAWSQVTTMLNNSYKGHLFKSLASLSIPNVPHDMEALSKSKEFAFFTTKLYSDTGDLPLFHYVINEVLRLRNISGSTENKQNQVLENFSNKLIFINLDVPEVAAAQAPSFRNKTVMHRGSDNTAVKKRIPASHVYADEAFKVRSYTLLLSLLSPSQGRVFVYGREGLPMFTQRIPIFAQKNFLFPVLMQKLYALESAGIFGKWVKTSEAASITAFVNKGISLAANYGIAVEKIHRILLPLIYEDLSPPKEENIVQPLSLGFMIGPFEALGFGLVGCMLPFIVELIRGGMKSRKAKSINATRKANS